MRTEPTSPSHYLRAWRNRQGYSIEFVAAEIEITNLTLSKIERHTNFYHQLILERLAVLYGCAPGDLIVRDPFDPEGIWLIWDNALPDQRELIVEIAKAIQRTA